MILRVIALALASYFLGNHNGAICVSSMLHDDVRAHGSGNAGLTNFVRNYGAGRALLVVAIDVGKAILACWLSGLLLQPYGAELEGRALGGVWAMMGHDFPALQGFRGGKGILSGWFIAWMVDWRIGLLIGIVFFAAYLLTRYVSLGSVLAAATFIAGFAVFYYDNLPVLLCGIFMGLLTLYMHRENIVRLFKGEERKTNLFTKGKQK